MISAFFVRANGQTFGLVNPAFSRMIGRWMLQFCIVCTMDRSFGYPYGTFNVMSKLREMAKPKAPYVVGNIPAPSPLTRERPENMQAEENGRYMVWLEWRGGQTLQCAEAEAAASQERPSSSPPCLHHRARKSNFVLATPLLSLPTLLFFSPSSPSPSPRPFPQISPTALRHSTSRAAVDFTAIRIPTSTRGLQ